MLGKPVGSDLKNDKATYPKVMGIERSWEIAHQSAERAIDDLTIFGPEADPLRAMAQYMVERDS